MTTQPLQTATSLPEGDGVTLARIDELLALRHEVPRLGAGRRARVGSGGQHLSRMHARGVDYAESRVYQPGDDIRAMDWRVTARTGKPHTKLYLEERERDLVLLLDLNPGMRFGTRRRYKSVQALRCAALAAWMTASGRDRVGALTFGGSQEWLGPRGGNRGVLLLLGDLLRLSANLTADEQTLSAALRTLLHRLDAGSRVLLISDGFSCDEGAGVLLKQLRSRADVAVLGVQDALEARVPPVNTLDVIHNGKRRRVLLGRRGARQDFAQAMGQGRAQLDALCRAAHVPVQWLDNQTDPRDSLCALLGNTLTGLRR